MAANGSLAQGQPLRATFEKIVDLANEAMGDIEGGIAEWDEAPTGDSDQALAKQTKRLILAMYEAAEDIVDHQVGLEDRDE